MKVSIIEFKREEEKKFESFNDLIAHLESVENTSEWVECKADEILFAENPEGVPFEGLGGDEFQCVTFSKDYGFSTVPLRYTALQSILNRAECYGNGIKELFLANKDKFAQHINDFFALKQGRKVNMKALIQDGKLSALHSGSYKEIPMTGVFDLVENFLEDFEDTTFLGASWTWDNTQALWRLEDADMLNTYDKLFRKYLTYNKLYIELLAISSDTAESAVRFYPRFYIDGRVLPFSGGSSVKHIGKVDLDTVDQKLYNVYTSFEASCRNLTALGDITLNNKKNVMIKAFSKLNIPQKYAAELCESYGNNTQTTALNIYVSMCDVLTAMKGNLSDTTVLNYEEQLTKLITFNKASWSRMDVPGNVSWSAKKD